MTERLPLTEDIICIRGAGDLATGVIQKLMRSGMRVFVLEIENPTAIRRHVALSSAIQNKDKTMEVEDVKGCFVESKEEIKKCWEKGEVPIMIDPFGKMVEEMKPIGVVDAILAKKNLGTHRKMAPVTIGLGPGFTAGEDVDVVVETMRGAKLGRLIFKGEAIPNTGVPGNIGGQAEARVFHAISSGSVESYCNIGDDVKEGDLVLKVGGEPMYAPFDGVIRGMIVEGMKVPKGFKIADIDPRKLDQETIFSISDKARCLGGGVLEAFLYEKRLKNWESNIRNNEKCSK